MIVALVLVVASGFLLWLETILECPGPAIVAVLIGVPTVMIWFLFRGATAVPKCPKCRQRMIARGDTEVDRTVWRIVSCRQCDATFRVPGVSSNN